MNPFPHHYTVLEGKILTWSEFAQEASISSKFSYRLIANCCLDLEELTQHFLLSKHPYICVKRLRGLKTLQVSGSFTHELDQLIYLGDLFSIIQENDGLSVSYCKTFSLQLAHAIDFIHKLGLAHRNINTENIFVFEREKSPLIKLSCFDYACALGSLDSTDLIIKRRLKTNPFAPPELQTTLLNGSRDIQSGIASTKEDTWAFAVVVFCMITNHYPWRFSTDRDEHYQSFRDKVLRPHNNQYVSIKNLISQLKNKNTN